MWSSRGRLIGLLVSVSVFYAHAYGIQDRYFIKHMRALSYADEQEIALFKQLGKQIPDDTQRIVCNNPEYSNLLFTCFPNLQKSIPYIALCSLPTPIIHAKILTSVLNIKNVYIKQESETGSINSDLTEPSFSGNKVRKLEWLLADAIACGAQDIITIGGIGSNHTVATAAYAKQLGLRTHVICVPHLHSGVAQRNLLLHQALGTNLIYCPMRDFRKPFITILCADIKARTGKFPYVIPTGGSIARGALGYVNAACEIKEQIDQGLLPKPDVIYVVAGSFGTVSGLLVGLRAVGVDSHVIAVAIEPENTNGDVQQNILKLCAHTVAFLRDHDSCFPDIQITTNDFTIDLDHSGDEYAKFTLDGKEAIELMRTIGVELDGVYTAKAAAALVADARAGKLIDKNVLFINTFSAAVSKRLLHSADKTQLPQLLQHCYFDQPIPACNQLCD